MTVSVVSGTMTGPKNKNKPPIFLCWPFEAEFRSFRIMGEKSHQFIEEYLPAV